MEELKDLNEIKSIVKVEGIITNETPLRIGSGRTYRFDVTTDTPIITLGEKPYIPGSSLKGLFRSYVEQLSVSREDWKGKTHLCLPGIDDPDKCMTFKENSICIPCYIFGWGDIASRIYILDSPVISNYKIGFRTMVAINRVFGGQQPKMLYNLDFVEPGAQFSFKSFIYNLNLIEGESNEFKNMATEALKSLFTTFYNEGMFIGGRKSTGYGLIRLSSATFRLYKLEKGELKVVKELDIKDLR